jgi:uncharacterized protein (DUF433 family)
MRTNKDIRAFSTEQVAKLAGLTKRQLTYWAKTEMFLPTLSEEGRLYTFRDVVGLKTLALLRRVVPLQELRRVSKWLAERYESPWSRLKFGVRGREVVFLEPDTGAVRSTRPLGQGVLKVIHLDEVANDIEQRVARLFERSREQIGQIEQKRKIVGNAPVIAGTRITTSAIWSFVEEGYKPAQIRKQYPRLTIEDIEKAIEFERDRRAKKAAG